MSSPDFIFSSNNESFLPEVFQPESPLETRLQSLLELALSPELLTYHPQLVHLIEHPETDPQLLCSIAIVLTRLTSHLSIPNLQVLARHPNPLVREYAHKALGKFPEEAVVSTLVAGLQDPDNQVFAAAAEALGGLGHHAVAALCEVVRLGPNDARCAAAWQLGEIGHPHAVEALVEALESSETSNDVKALALWALGEIGTYTDSVARVLAWGRQQSEPDIRLRAETAHRKLIRSRN